MNESEFAQKIESTSEAIKALCSRDEQDVFDTMVRVLKGNHENENVRDSDMTAIIAYFMQCAIAHANYAKQRAEHKAKQLRSN